MSLRFAATQRVPYPRSGYASPEDFQKLFAREMMDLFRLGYLLTANIEKAERALILAIRDCMSSGCVSREWMLLWARRAVVRNAIKVVGCENGGEDVTAEAHERYRRGAGTDELLGSLCIEGLSDFHRLVYVICVLEGYALHDCALLLSRTHREIHEAKDAAIEHVIAYEREGRLRRKHGSELEEDSPDEFERSA